MSYAENSGYESNAFLIFTLYIIIYKVVGWIQTLVWEQASLQKFKENQAQTVVFVTTESLLNLKEYFLIEQLDGVIEMNVVKQHETL